MEKTFVKKLSMGEIRGIENEKTVEYRGVRYATANRWEYPQAVESWQGEYDASVYKNCCYQMRAFEEDSVCNPFYSKEFRAGMSFKYGNDCLFLNITAPKNAENCPVLLFIHGGSFTGGSCDEGHIRGERFAENGIVFVAINYRLGPYGFCSHPDLENKNGVCGNFGLYDQHTAIKWVYEHINEFGGDKEKITLMGQSAGAMSLDIQCSSPLNKGMIKGAVLLSGAGLQRYNLRPLTPKKTEKFWNSIIKNANASSMEELKNTDEKTLYYAWLQEVKKSPLNILKTFPVYDGRLLTKKSFAKNNLADMPYMLGLTVTDMVPYVLYYNLKKWVGVCKNHQSPVYTFLFSRLLPGDDKGAWHACDLLYFFSTLKINWRPFEAVDYKLSDEMSDSVIAFVKNGNPNCKALPHWEKGIKMPMVFCENSRSEKWNIKTLLKNTFSKGQAV